MPRKIENSEAFDREVLKVAGPVLVDFYADWCGPCRAMLPVIEEISKELSGQVEVVKVNIDQASQLAAQYQVRSIPNFVVIKDGQVRDRLIGAQSKQALINAVKPHLN